MRHPLHPALVHFPVACWSLAVAADFGALHFGAAAWGWSGGLLVVGCVTGLAAMAAGLLELSRIPEGPVLRETYWHMGAMMTAGTLFATRLLLRWDQGQLLAPDTLSLLLDAAGIVALVVGGWIGGRLVYAHGVGRSPG